MKRFLIHVSTSWCGMDDTFRAMAENDYELDAQKSYTNEDAVKLFHDKMKEICND